MKAYERNPFGVAQYVLAHEAEREIDRLTAALAKAEENYHRAMKTGPYITSESWNNACGGLGTKP
jgi:hypothetical protein